MWGHKEGPLGECAKGQALDRGWAPAWGAGDSGPAGPWHPLQPDWLSLPQTHFSLAAVAKELNGQCGRSQGQRRASLLGTCAWNLQGPAVKGP